MNRPADPPATEAPARFFVGIGGSAGSLEAIQEILEHLPERSTGAAYFIVTHAPADHHSLLPQILREHTERPIIDGHQAGRIGADTVYIVPSRGDWVLEEGHLRARAHDAQERAEAQEHSRGRPHAIDAFFRSLAREAGERAVGIVLSGTGTDGTLGVQAIKSQSGMAIAQEPGSCQFESMPRSALETHLVDAVLRPAEIPHAVLHHIEGVDARSASGDAAAPEIPEQTLAAIFHEVRKRTGYDFSGYKRSTLVRRLERRMHLHRLETPEAYLAFLQRNPGEIDLLFKEVIISVTSFFRDPEAWQLLAEGPLLERLRSAPAERGFRAWVMGCATGEEAYTLAILVSECLEALGEPPRVQIFATDINAEALEIARAGRYPAGIAEDLSAERLARHFIAEEDTYRVSKSLRDMVIFARHDLLRDPPFTRMDLVTCRNLLIYLKKDLQAKLFQLFHYSLADGGLLMLGPSESMDSTLDAFEVLHKQWRLYRRQGGWAAERLPQLPGVVARRSSLESQPPAETPAQQGATELGHSIARLLADEFAPPCLLVNDRGEVVYIHGRTGRYLEPAPGPAQNHLLDMARPGLRAPLAQALRDVAGQDAEEIVKHARVQTNGAREAIEVRARRLRTPPTLKGLRLVSLQPQREGDQAGSAPAPEAAAGRRRGPAGGEPAGASGEEGSEEAGLRQELEALQRDKQITVEELQSSNEELQSMNEELQSMNEELQSSNEELEVSKEEVESLNEELRTVNAELESRVNELSQANDDMKNLLESTDIATLFLDEQMRIKRFTEAARNLVSLRPNDIGRPIDELATNLDYSQLTADAHEVLSSLRPKEVDVQTVEGDWYRLRIMPYRTTQNAVDGLVCTFHDIQAAKRLELSEAYFRHIVHTIREPLLILDAGMRIVSANRGFYRLTGMAPEQVEGEELFRIGGGRWDHPELRALLEEVLPTDHRFEDLELEIDPGLGKRRRLRLNARMLQEGEEQGRGRILLAMEPAPD